MFKDLLHLIFPRECPACERDLVRQEGAVCWSCLADIEETDFHLNPSENDLFRRFAGRIPLEGAASLFFFDKKGKFQKIISSLKYHNQPQVGEFLGNYYGEKLKNSEFISSAQCLVPVPLHPSKLRKRGYNQSLAIAQGLSESLSIPVNDELLSRIRKTETQTRKDQDDRWANVKGGFKVKENASQHILLIDDVITTGATLAACIGALYESPHPPKSVGILCLGMARKE